MKKEGGERGGRESRPIFVVFYTRFTHRSIRRVCSLHVGHSVISERRESEGRRGGGKKKGKKGLCLAPRSLGLDPVLRKTCGLKRRD